MAEIMARYVVNAERANPDDQKMARDIDKVGDDERQKRSESISAIWTYYDGNHPDMLKTPMGKKNKNIVNNLTRRVVDKLVEFVGEPEFVQVVGAAPDSDAQILMDDMVEAHRGVYQDVIQSGIVAGHVFVKLMMDEENRARFALLDSRMMTKFVNIMNPAETVFYRLQWSFGSTNMRQDIVPRKFWTPDLFENAPAEAGWVIIDYTQTRGGQWTLSNADYWLYDFAPIVDWKNKARAHRHYGLSDVDFAPRANDMVNFLESNTAKIIEVHAHPRTIGKGVSANQIEKTSIDGFFTVPLESDVFNLEMQSDLASSMAFAQQKRADFFASAQVVDSSTVKDKIGQMTNFGLRVFFDDMIKSAEDKHGRYGDGMAEVFRRMMAMMGVELDVSPLVIWSERLPMNRLEKLQAAQIETGLRTTSKRTIAQEIGRDYEAEREQIAMETSESGELLADVLAMAGERGAF